MQFEDFANAHYILSQPMMIRLRVAYSLFQFKDHCKRLHVMMKLFNSKVYFCSLSFVLSSLFQQSHHFKIFLLLVLLPFSFSHDLSFVWGRSVQERKKYHLPFSSVLNFAASFAAPAFGCSSSSSAATSTSASVWRGGEREEKKKKKRKEEEKRSTSM